MENAPSFQIPTVELDVPKSMPQVLIMGAPYATGRRDVEPTIVLLIAVCA
jgi:hypothetical protein